MSTTIIRNPYDSSTSTTTIRKSIELINKKDKNNSSLKGITYEIRIRKNNTSLITARFQDSNTEK